MHTEKAFEPISSEEIRWSREESRFEKLMSVNSSRLKTFHFWVVHILAVIGVAFIIGGVWIAYGPPTYNNNEEFISAIQQGSIKSGETADLLVLDVEENPIFGYNLTVAEDVVLIGYEGMDVQEGDYVRITIGSVINPTGYAWMVTYDLQDIH